MTTTDHEFLLSNGYQVIEDPAAVRLVSPTTFLYTPCADWPHVRDLLSNPNAYPALYVGNNIPIFEKRLE